MRAGDLDIPTARLGEPAWRQRDRRSRPRVLVTAGAIAALAFAGALALVGTGERTDEGDVPVIVADAGPFRVRPADPGGMQVPNQDQLVYQRMAGGGDPPAGRRIEVLLPPPEAPLPVPRPAPPAPAPAAAPAEAPPPGEPVRVPEPAPEPAGEPAREAVAPPAQAGAAAALPLPPPPPPAAAQAAPRAEGSVQVQLAAVGTEAAVQSEWNRLRSRMPDLLGDQTLTVSRGDRDGQAFWRVRTGRFADVAAARGFCEQVRARGFTCFVVGGS